MSPRAAVLRPFLASRAAVFAVAWISLVVAPITDTKLWRAFPTCPALDGWARWDSGWYAGIALRGYNYTPGTWSNVNFFPLYPWLTHLLSFPLQLLLPQPQAFYLTGMLLSLGTFWLALVGLWQLIQPQWGEEIAQKTLWLLAFFPFSLFFSAVYTESVFLALTVWTLVFARQQRWFLACLLASLAAVTRSVGGLIGLTLAVEYLHQRRLRPDRQILWFLVVPLPLIALMFWWNARFGEPLPFLKTYTTVWDKRPGLSRLIDVLNSVRNPHEDPVLRLQNAVYFAVIFAAIGLCLARMRQLGPALAGYAIVSALIVAATGFNGAGRYAAVLFPAFLALAMLLKNQRWFLTVMALQIPLCLWFTWDFAHAWRVN